MNLRRSFLALLATGLALCVQSQASVVLFDDAAGPDWKVDWGSTNTTIKYSGTASLAPDPSNNQLVFLPLSTYTVGSNPLFDFYVNTTTNAGITVELRINNNDLGNNGGGTYMVDGVAQQGSLTIDGDSSTWQHVTFDITQPRWYWGNGWESTSMTSTSTVDRVSFNTGATLLIDSVQFTAVPEPTAIAGIGALGLVLLRRRNA